MYCMVVMSIFLLKILNASSALYNKVFFLVQHALSTKKKEDG